MADGKLHWTISEDATKPTHLLGAKPAHAVVINGEEIAHSGRKITPSILKTLRAKVASVEVEASELDAAVTAADVVDTNTGEVIVEANLDSLPSVCTASSSRESPPLRSSSLSGMTSATSSRTPCAVTPSASRKRR